jgi:hypothetical protein
MLKRRFNHLLGFLFLVALALHQPSMALSYPTHPVRLVTPYPPGGGTDAVARPLAASFSKAWGQPVVVDNRGSAGGVIAVQMVASAQPDGYTLFLSSSGVMVSAPLIMKSTGVNIEHDFKTVGLASILPAFLMTQASAPVNTVQELINLARSNPKKYTFSSSGTGGGHHLAVELLKALTGVDVTHVPYKGGGPAIVALLGSEVSYTFGNYPAARPHLQSGRLKAIAVAGEKRSVLMPQIPTMVESGLPEFIYMTWYGIFVPAKTPTAIIRFVNDAMKKALAERSIAEPLLTQGAEASWSSPEELARIMKAESLRWKKVIASQHLTF